MAGGRPLGDASAGLLAPEQHVRNRQPRRLAAQKTDQRRGGGVGLRQDDGAGRQRHEHDRPIGARDERGQKVVVVEAQRVAVGGLGRRRAAARDDDVGARCRRERRVEVVARDPDDVCAVSPERVEDARDAGRDDATGAAHNVIITEVPPFHERLGVVDRRTRAADDGDLTAWCERQHFIIFEHHHGIGS